MLHFDCIIGFGLRLKCLCRNNHNRCLISAESELLGGQKAPPLPQMSEAKTAAELEATIKQRIGLQQRNDQPLPSSSHHSAAEPRKMSPQPQQSDAGEMSAFKKFVSST